MKPIKLEMQAFGSYGGKTTIDFEKLNQNLFLITGDTGSGKSTIFDAIVFALYGVASTENDNAKKGKMFFSQFAIDGAQPYVELTFTNGNRDDIYTVRRTPEYFRKSKRKTKNNPDGLILESSKLTFTMPDGREYPQKEANKKIEEIVGLNKKQFMQVAMIAQGEFMNTIRAKSKEKTEIFRKLFNTEIYRKIIDELKARADSGKSEVDEIKTQCKYIVINAQIPEENENLLNIKRYIQDGNLSVVNDFLNGMNNLCNSEKAFIDSKLAESANLEAKLKNANKRLTLAGSISESFKNLEQAQQTLEECAHQEDEIKKLKQLLADINNSYEINNKFKIRDIVSNNLNKAKYESAKINELLPKLKQNAEECQSKYNSILELSEKSNNEFSQLQEKANEALKKFDNIDELSKTIEYSKNKLEENKILSEKIEQEINDYKNRVEKAKTETEKFADISAQIADCKNSIEKLNAIKNDLSDIDISVSEINSTQSSLNNSQQEYSNACELFERGNKLYEQKRRIFLDSQAGLLAKELKDGAPCPVCGSLEHPSPCAIDFSVDITRESLETLQNKVDELRKIQTEKSNQANIFSNRLEEQKKNLKKLKAKLINTVRQIIPVIDENTQIDVIKSAVENEKIQQQNRLQELNSTAARISQLKKFLAQSETTLEAMNLKYRKLEENGNKIKTEILSTAKLLESEQNSLSYNSKEELYKILRDKSDESKNIKLKLNESFSALETAKNNLQKNTALLTKYNDDIPNLSTDFIKADSDYKKLISKYNLSETQWKSHVDEYNKDNLSAINDKIDEYNNKKAAATALKEISQAAVEGKEYTDIEALKNKVKDFENQIKTLNDVIEQHKEIFKTNNDIYNRLKSQTANQQQILDKFATADRMYRLFSGKETGSRMDIETFAQRYYMQQILLSANKRFYEMSAGQYELQMLDADKAGEGANKGLDLMVYSFVTGKKREITTLSGGESFMAALSLALGMSDQIQSNSASVNLDIMFIDEGFGTLDERSRNQAVKVLKNMAEGSKLIGIISHVSELKNEIDNQLIVTKDDTGSHIKWQIS